MIMNGWCSCMAGRGHSCSHIGAILWKIDHAVRNNLTGLACIDESANWNRGTTRNVEPRALSSINFKKPKVGQDIIENANNFVPDTLDTSMYTSDVEFKDAVRNSSLFPLYNIKGTTANKSFSCTPFVNDMIQEDHCEHTSLESCSKCKHFLQNYIQLSNAKINNLELSTPVYYGKMPGKYV